MILEEELARVAAAHFGELGVIFPEVSCWTSGPRADLVVVRADASLDVVECKRAPTEVLLRQINRWGAHADRLWVCYEPPRRGAVTQRWLHRFVTEGIGVVHIIGNAATVATEPAQGQVLEHFRARLVAALTPLHSKYGAPGNARSEFYSPFRHTCDNLRAAVFTTPGLTMREAVDLIAHHYSSDKVARSSLLAWIRNKKVRGVEARLDGRRARLYPTPTSPEAT